MPWLANLCDRHTDRRGRPDPLRAGGRSADGLILYAPADPHTMRLFNADGSPSEVSGNGVRGLAALLLRNEAQAAVDITIQTDAGIKRLARTGVDGSRQTFRAAMGWPVDLRRTSLVAVGEHLHVVVMTFGNPQAIVLGPLPDDARFQRLGPAIASRDVPREDQRRVRACRIADVGAHSDLGARGWSDVVVGYRVVRVADCRGRVRRRRPVRRGYRPRRNATGRMGQRQRLSDRVG